MWSIYIAWEIALENGPCGLLVVACVPVPADKRIKNTWRYTAAPIFSKIDACAYKNSPFIATGKKS